MSKAHLDQCYTLSRANFLSQPPNI